MFRRANKICLYIGSFIYILLISLLVPVIALSVTGPQNNLFPWQMAVGTAVGTILLLCAFSLWDRLP